MKPALDVQRLELGLGAVGDGVSVVVPPPAATGSSFAWSSGDVMAWSSGDTVGAH